MLRLLYGDAYTDERLKRFGMADSDRCRRCFDKETVHHLLMECPYSCEVYKILGIQHTDINISNKD